MYRDPTGARRLCSGGLKPGGKGNAGVFTPKRLGRRLLQNTKRRKSLLRGAEGEEILGAFDGVLEAAEELLQVVAALDKINFGGVDDQEVGGGVAEEEMFVGAGDFLDVFERDLRLLAGGFLGDAGAQDFGLGLQVDNEVRRRKIGGQQFVIALVEL